MERQMIRNVKLSAVIFATALLGGVALVPSIASAQAIKHMPKPVHVRPVRMAPSARKEVEGTKADRKTDRAEANMMRHHEVEGSKADIAEDKAEAKLKK
jgi:hypothetical protein